MMKTFETAATIDSDGGLTMERLPFACGESVRVRIERKADVAAAEKAGKRVLGLHQGMVWMSDDIDVPLPDSFWLGQNSADETPA